MIELEAASLPIATRQNERTASKEIREALAMLANFGGNVSRTSREIGVARRTLADWRDNYFDAYVEIAQKLEAETDGRIIQKFSDLSESAIETAQLAVDKSFEQLEAGEDKVPAATFQRMVTGAAIGQDKRLLLQGRPTQITAQSPNEVLTALRERMAQAGAIDVESEDA